jgi:hypothetical protein
MSLLTVRAELSGDLERRRTELMRERVGARFAC